MIMNFKEGEIKGVIIEKLNKFMMREDFYQRPLE